jgi:CubicO group peptidase (beta-lactamase class C family)
MAQTPKLAGDYSGMLGPLYLKLHLKTPASGAIEGTLDSVDQGAMGLAGANLHSEGKAFSFDVPGIGGKWHGTVSDDGATLTGSWSQGQEIPLVFHRDQAFAAADKPSSVDGIWLGTLSAGGADLRVQIQVKSDRAGKLYCSLDSLDQGAIDLACENVKLDGNRFSFEVPAVKGKWDGTLAENGNELAGTWTQRAGLPLRFTRQTSLVKPKAPEPPKLGEAMPPVPLAELKPVLDRDLAVALKEGALAPSTGGGVAIGVLQHGNQRILTYGPIQEDSIFEIGSVTKTFTALILAQMAVQHKVKLDDPVRELLPPGTVAKPDGTEITLLDLATQHSGLPRLPDNLLQYANLRDPYVDYRPANLYQYIAKHGLAKPPDPPFNYSNLGLGLLGQALANRAASTYPDLLRALVTEPLKLADTVVKLSAEQEKRFAIGHNAQHRPAQAWNFDALAGAVRSTAGDMLTYLDAQLHPDRTAGTLATTSSSRSFLNSPLRRSFDGVPLFSRIWCTRSSAIRPGISTMSMIRRMASSRRRMSKNLQCRKTVQFGFNVKKRSRLPPRRAKSTRSARRIGQLPLHPLHRLITRYDHLGNAVARMDRVSVAPQIQQDYTKLAAISGVDRPRRVGHGDGVLQRQAAARTHLGFVPRRNLHHQSGRHQPGHAGLQRGLFHRAEVHAGVFVRAVSVFRQDGIGPELLYSQLHPAIITS